MQNIILYLVAVLSWGSTWYVIKFQLGTVDPVVSVGYRFALASLILFTWCWLRRLNLNFSLKNHFFMLLQGMFLFSINYFCFYWATDYLASGLNAVVFSTVMIFNIMNSALFFRTPINLSVVLGALLGVIGICMIFWPQLSILDFSSGTIVGMAFCLVGAILGSWGNMLSFRNQKNFLPVIETNAYAMGYGALFTLLVATFQGIPLTFDWSVSYVGSMIYLSLIGSVIAFGCYLTLLGRIGASRASYALILSPIIALVISTLLVDFNWTFSAISGVGLILSGNVLVLMRKQGIKLNKPLKEATA